MIPLGSCDDVAETAGIVPRALRQIFRHLETQSETEYSVRCTFLELYNEEITFALERRREQQIGIREQIGILRDDDRVGVRCPGSTV